MKAKVIETGEVVNVTPNPTWYKENGQGPDRREWDEDELEFIPSPNAPKMVSLNEVCEWLSKHFYDECYQFRDNDGTWIDADELIEDLKKEMEK